jgi:hypothetical protein
MDWKPDDKKVERLRGTVVPSEWGVDDEVTVVSIVTEDAEEYTVSESRMVRRLMKHMDEVVEVDGFLGEDEYGEPVLVVGDFVPMAAAEDSDDLDLEDDLEDELEDDEEEYDEDEDDEEFESYSLRRRTSTLRRSSREAW